MRVDADAAERELDHVAPPDDHDARRTQPRHCRRIGPRGRRIVEHFRTGPGDVARHVVEVLHRNGDAFDRRTHDAGATQPVGVVGFGQGRFGVRLCKRPRTLPSRVGDARQGLLHERSARNLACGEFGAEPCDGPHWFAHPLRGKAPILRRTHRPSQQGGAPCRIIVRDANYSMATCRSRPCHPRVRRQLLPLPGRKPGRPLPSVQWRPSTPFAGTLPALRPPHTRGGGLRTLPLRSSRI